MARLIIVDDNPELAALIASAVRSRGHTAITAHDGGAALEATALIPCDLALVDLHLPDMRGSELLSKLRVAGVRTIAISGVYKGDLFSREAIHTHGASAYFEKPFEMSALLDTIDSVAGSSIPTANKTEVEVEDEDRLEELAPIEEDGHQSFILPAPPRTAAVAETPVAARSVGAPSSPPDDPLPFANRHDVWERPQPALGPQTPRRPADLSQAGDLRTSSVPRLLTAYYQAKHFGELKLRQGNVIKVVFFEQGQPVYAASNLAQERFGRFCVRRGKLTPEALVDIARVCKEQNIRTGESMIRAGLLNAEERRQLLEDQIREIIWSTFTWNEGHFQFYPKRPTRTDIVKLSVFPGDLILQGVNKTETLIGLRKRMPASLLVERLEESKLRRISFGF